MDGRIAQETALVLQANAHLIKGERFAFDLSHSTATYCAGIRFIDLSDKGIMKMIQGLCARFLTSTEATCDRADTPALSHIPVPTLSAAKAIVTVAHSPREWVKVLRKVGVRLLKLHYVPSTDITDERYSCAFIGGGGRWLIETCREEYSDYWEPGTQVSRPAVVEGRPFWISYCRVARDVSMEQARFEPLSEVSDRLHAALVEIGEFARKQRQRGWANCFKKAQLVLEAKSPIVMGYYKDLVPPSLSREEPLRVLAACNAAWVFRGMGSWNDIGFPGEAQQIYEEVSNNLYSAICAATVAAVNSFSDLKPIESSGDSP